MRIGVPAETAPGERRVSLVPEGVHRLARAGVEVTVERGAGDRAWFRDAAYERAGARLGGAEEALSADLVLKVRRPSEEEVARMRRGGALVGLLQPATGGELFRRLAERGVDALAMELVPRITRAQAIDALSSQATVAGYRAVILAASRAPRLFPMLTTAAGPVAPARLFVIGAGVAGLQAIATGRRLGAVVSAFDVRPAVREQVASLGAAFLESEVAASEGAGGYAAELPEEARRRVLEAVGRHLVEQDVVVTTAQVPGKRAPVLVTGDMVRAMRPGSVIVDLAGETGGNTEVTRPGEEVDVGGVLVLAPLDLPSAASVNASQMYSRNLEALLKLVLAGGQLRLDPSDEVVGPMIAVLGGRVHRENP
jgi:NAD(P) transhydrogenase subunit alpha